MRTRKESKMLLKKSKIRSCSVKLNRLNIQDDKQFRDALFRMHHICDLKIILCRVNESMAAGPKRKLLGNVNKRSVRSNVNWIPTNSTSMDKAAKATKAAQRRVVISTANEALQKKKPTPKLNPSKRRRAASMFVERPVMEMPFLKPTNDDFYAEILEKRANLKPVNERQLGPRVFNEPIPQLKLIHQQFQQTMAAKIDSKNKKSS